ncbi:hypothetical protein EB077_11645, partial [bacterium]|nr:hypothetical protein [bacterium]
MAQSITLQTSDSDIISGDILGRLSFAASSETSGSDALLIGGGIYAEAEDTFTQIANPTSLIFATASSETAIGKLKITSSGYFLPLLNNTYDIGSSSFIFRNLYVNSGIFTNLSVSGINVSLAGHTHTSSNITDFNTAVSGLITNYALLNSPSLTGIPLAPTASVDTNTNQIASTAFVLGQAASITPIVNGTASIGTSTRFARADHIHPTDTSRAALTGAAFTGSISAPSGNFTQTLQINGTGVSISGHTHTSSNITDFNTSVSGLLPVKNIVAGNNITISSASGIYTINSTASGGGGSSSTSVRGNIIATGTLSSFNISGGYSVGYLDLFQNGVKLLAGSDFTATDGTSVTLTNSIPSGTVLEYISLGASLTSTNYTKLDSISSSFNGSSTSFGLAVSGTAYYPVSANTLGIYVGGVAQEPISSYSVSGSNIIFTEAPASGLTFWGVGYGTTAVATLNGIVPGSSGSPAISSSNDLNTGFYFPSSGSIAVANTGVQSLIITSSGNIGIGTGVPTSKLHVVGNCNVVGTLTVNDFTESVVVIGNSSTAKTISLTNGTIQTCTLTGNCTFTMPTAIAGKSFTLFLSSGSGSFTASFTGVKWSGGTAPTITTTANKIDILSFISDGTFWYGS